MEPFHLCYTLLTSDPGPFLSSALTHATSPRIRTFVKHIYNAVADRRSGVDVRRFERKTHFPCVLRRRVSSCDTLVVRMRLHIDRIQSRRRQVVDRWVVCAHFCGVRILCRAIVYSQNRRRRSTDGGRFSEDLSAADRPVYREGLSDTVTQKRRWRTGEATTTDVDGARCLDASTCRQQTRLQC